MIQYILRLAKRFAVLAPGVAIAYLSFRGIFPYFNEYLPAGFALLFTYIIAAYIILPALIRFWRSLQPTKHLPLYCVTPDGFASDPLNIGIIGTKQELVEAMERAGWYKADPHTPHNVGRQIITTIFGGSYPKAPVSNLYLFGRKQDVAFEIPVEGAVGTRHHVRFWATTYEDKKRLTLRTIHWHNRREHIQDSRLLWVGAASLDVGIGFIRHNLQLTHMIDPDTNQERHLIVSQLKTQKLINKQQSLTLGKPYRVMNRVFRGSLHTDGKMTIITLPKMRKTKRTTNS